MGDASGAVTGITTDGGPGIRMGDVRVTRSAINVNKGYQWTVTFVKDTNDLKRGNLPELIAVSDNMNNSPKLRVEQIVAGQREATTTVTGSREVQLITPATATSPISGWWRVRYRKSEWTNYMPSDVSDVDLQYALEGLTTIGKVTVTGAPAPAPARSPAPHHPLSVSNGKQWTVRFDTNVGDVPALELDVSKLTPVSADPSRQPLTVFDGDNAVKSSGSYETSDYNSYGLASCSDCVIGEAPVEYGFFETVDASVSTFQIPNLVPGTVYSVAVTAKNARGYGERRYTTPAALELPRQVPGKPTNVAIDVQYGDWQRLKLTYNPPISDGGSPVTKYRVEWDTTPEFNINPQHEVYICPNSQKRAEWTVTSSASDGVIVGGSFRLRLRRGGADYDTDAIAYNAFAKASEETGGLTGPEGGGTTVMCTSTAYTTEGLSNDPDCTAPRIATSGSVELKMEALSAITDVTVTRTGPTADGGYSWTITFNDDKDDFALSVDPAAVQFTKAGGGALTGAVAVNKIVSQACRLQAECGMALSTCAGCTYTSCTGTRAVPVNGGLIKGTFYFMRVFAYNGMGYSDPQIVAAKQKPMVIPSAPTGVTLEVYTHYSLKVLFSPPDDLGGDDVLTYMIEWDTDPDFTNSTGNYNNYVKVVTVDLMAGAQQFKIGSATEPLGLGVDYYVRVKGANSQGYGPSVRSVPPFAHPSRAPELPSNIQLFSTSTTLITVTWEPPLDTASGEPGNGGDAINSYVIRWDIQGDFDSPSSFPNKGEAIVDKSERAYTIGSDRDGSFEDKTFLGALTAGTPYYVDVVAVNDLPIPDGPRGLPIPLGLAPQENLPGRLGGVTAVALASPGDIRVSYVHGILPYHGRPCFGTPAAPSVCPTIVDDHPTDPNTLPDVIGGIYIREIKVEYQPVTPASTTWTAVLISSDADIKNKQTTITGLASGVQLNIRVSICNSRGCSNPCDKAGTTSCDVPPSRSRRTEQRARGPHQFFVITSMNEEKKKNNDKSKDKNKNKNKNVAIYELERQRTAARGCES